jgi:hypothetical protein
VLVYIFRDVTEASYKSDLLDTDGVPVRGAMRNIPGSILGAIEGAQQSSRR